jgi:2-dehydro-3-deoxygluconokinase
VTESGAVRSAGDGGQAERPLSATGAVDVVTVGETMGLLSADEIGPWRSGHRMVLGIAGAESNVAVGVRRLGRSAAWISRVGNDPIGRLIVRELRGEGVDVSHVVVDDVAPTGFMFKVHRTTATSEVMYARSGSAASRLCPGDLPEGLIASARVLHLTGITPALSASARETVERAVQVAHDHRVPISLDVNHRNALWSRSEASLVLRALVPHCTLVFASEHEATLLAAADDGSAAASAVAIAALGPSHVLVKRGELGYAALIEGRSYAGDAVAVTVADPVGAGDAFVAGYLTRWLDGATPEEALETANLAGAFVVAVPGDWEGLPTRAELASFAARTDAVTR